MARGVAIPAAVHWIIIRLSSLLQKEDISIYTGVSLRSVERILKYFEDHHDIQVRDQGEEKRKNKILRDLDVEFLLGTVKQAPDLYLDELQEILAVNCGVNVSRATVWRTLCRAGFTMKKVTRIAAERSAEKRLDYYSRISQYQASQLVFVDESSVDRRTTYRGKAWSIRGTKAQRKAFFVRGRRFSVLPAIALHDGVLHCDVIEGSFTGAKFATFIHGLLSYMRPYPADNSVIVMDNCSVHKDPIIRQMIEERGMRCEYLPPYSPDFNPIELAFSHMKYQLRRNGDYMRLVMTHMSDTDIYTTLLKAVYSISPLHCRGWYQHCGYV